MQLRTKANKISKDLWDKVYIRDGCRCAICRKRGDSYFPLQMHHVVFRSRGGVAKEENLCCLCMFCHDMLHHSTLSLKYQDKVRDYMRSIYGSEWNEEDQKYHRK